MAKDQRSLVAEKTVEDQKTKWVIRGHTRPHTQTLLKAGATWEGSKVRWVYEGESLPAAIRDALDGVNRIEDITPARPAAVSPMGEKQINVGDWVKVAGDAYEVESVYGDRLQLIVERNAWGQATRSIMKGRDEVVLVEKQPLTFPKLDAGTWVKVIETGEIRQVISLTPITLCNPLDDTEPHRRVSTNDIVPCAAPKAVVVDMTSVQGDVETLRKQADELATAMGYTHVASIPLGKSAFKPVSKVTPLREQYLSIKAQYTECILFFRLGDFYETFDGDAEIAARELDLVLTSRPVSKTERVPMAGIPHHALEGYIAKLTEKGYSVAVCEQVTEPSGSGVIERKVTRVEIPTAAEKITFHSIVAPKQQQTRKKALKALIEANAIGIVQYPTTSTRWIVLWNTGVAEAIDEDDIRPATATEKAQLQEPEVGDTVLYNMQRYAKRGKVEGFDKDGRLIIGTARRDKAGVIVVEKGTPPEDEAHRASGDAEAETTYSFKVGDRVRHISGSEGEIARLDEAGQIAAVAVPKKSYSVTRFWELRHLTLIDKAQPSALKRGAVVSHKDYGPGVVETALGEQVKVHFANGSVQFPRAALQLYSVLDESLSFNERNVLATLYRWLSPQWNVRDGNKRFETNTIAPALIEKGYLRRESVLDEDDGYSLTPDGCKALGLPVPAKLQYYGYHDPVRNADYPFEDYEWGSAPRQVFIKEPTSETLREITQEVQKQGKTFVSCPCGWFGTYDDASEATLALGIHFAQCGKGDLPPGSIKKDSIVKNRSGQLGKVVEDQRGGLVRVIPLDENGQLPAVRGRAVDWPVDFVVGDEVQVRIVKAELVKALKRFEPEQGKNILLTIARGESKITLSTEAFKTSVNAIIEVHATRDTFVLETSLWVLLDGAESVSDGVVKLTYRGRGLLVDAEATNGVQTLWCKEI